MSGRLHVDWTRCRGRGLCVEWLLELLDRDEWGLPLPRHGTGDVVVPTELADPAAQAVRDCPRLALRLLPSEARHRAPRRGSAGRRSSLPCSRWLSAPGQRIDAALLSVVALRGRRGSANQPTAVRYMPASDSERRRDRAIADATGPVWISAATSTGGKTSSGTPGIARSRPRSEMMIAAAPRQY